MKENKDLISVIVPVYNVEKYIRRCLDSIVNQTYSNLEIILIDDGSKDASGKICDEYAKKDNRITVIHKQNGGLSDARNYGIDKAKGNYISFVDSDDYLSNDYISYLYKLLKENTADISVCDYQLFKNEIKPKDVEIVEKVYSKMEMLEHMLYGGHNLISAWCKLYDIKLFKKIRYPKGHIYEDVATTYLLYENSDKIVVSNEAKYYYFVREDSITNLEFSKNNYEIISSNDKMINYLSKYDNLEQALMRRKVFSRLSLLCKMVLSNYYGTDRNEITKYILENKKYILNNPNASKKDKIAVRLLSFSPKLFEIVWKIYKKREV